MHRVPALRLAAFYFTYLAALGAFSPFFGLYLATRGFDPWWISLLMSLWYGTRIVAPGAWSHMVARSAHPVHWLRIGAGGTLGFFALFLLDASLAGVLATMAVFAFFYNAIMPQFEALTFSHLSDAPGRYGRIRVWGSVGFIAVVLGLGAIFERGDVGTLPLYMLPMFGALLASTFLVDYGPAIVARDVRGRESPWTTLRRPGVALFVALAFLMQVAHGPYYVFYSIFLDAQGYGEGIVGVLWAVGVAAEIVVFWFAAPLLERFGAARAMRWCLAAAAVRFVAIAALPESLPALLLAQLAHALSFGLFHAACMMRAARLFPGALFGPGQGLLYGLGSGLGGVVGALLAGAGWRLGGGTLAFVLGAAAAAIGFALSFHARALPGARTAPDSIADEAR